ncbi:hypothetical protein DSO57_1001292 [Entomophthora muscae]|uniref:Uncharacterized protein n=3 Tax=Entomophthora muscae TaxID=34485 RepID=A0ACC2T8R2_9FUNG|nr:hypothetical protein DSO57_1001292 [Entomophthora muscae]
MMDPSQFTLRSFVTESSIEEIRKNRENVGDDEKPYDPRTLYERLAEQRQLKEEAFIEASKLGNLIHRIDDDESEFLNEIIMKEKRRKEEVDSAEREALKIYKKDVAKRNQMSSEQFESSLKNLIEGDNKAFSEPKADSEKPAKKQCSLKTKLSGIIQHKSQPPRSFTSTTVKTTPTLPQKQTEKSLPPPAKPVGALNLVDYGSDSD